jgi:hypothetical protein
VVAAISPADPGRQAAAVPLSIRLDEGAAPAIVSARPPRHELVLASLLTLVVAALLLGLGPAPGDAPAHLYRTFLVQHGSLIWDNLWYAGQYPLASYSLLYYVPAAVIGNLSLVIAGAVLSTLLFAGISYRFWGSAAIWPARLFGLFAAAPLFTGLYSYSLGFAALLGVLRALQSRRSLLGIVLAVVTLGLSPLAFVFLCLILLALALSNRHWTGRATVVALALAVIAAGQLLVMHLFPTPGRYPFYWEDLLAVLGVCAVGALLARHAKRGELITAFFVVWGLGSVIAFLVPTPIGDNWTRLREFVFPLMLLTASLARFRPRRLAIFALAGALGYNLVPYLMLIPYRLDSRPEHAAFWAPALAYVRSHGGPNYRVEVVPTAAHWESYWVPRSGVPLARGWYRQLDIGDNPVFYGKPLTPTAYRGWLRSQGIEFVLLPATRLDPVSAPAEATLLRTGRVGLEPVFRSNTGTVYQLPEATPLLTGPGLARLTALTHTTVAGRVGAAGSYLLRVHYNPHWALRGAGVCLRAAAGGMTELVASAPGGFELTQEPGLNSFLGSLIPDDSRSCSQRSQTPGIRSG